jgi:hypothetical protein
MTRLLGNEQIVSCGNTCDFWTRRAQLDGGFPPVPPGKFREISVPHARCQRYPSTTFSVHYSLSSGSTKAIHRGRSIFRCVKQNAVLTYSNPARILKFTAVLWILILFCCSLSDFEKFTRQKIQLKLVITTSVCATPRAQCYTFCGTN